jgi:hypothetical protein
MHRPRLLVCVAALGIAAAAAPSSVLAAGDAFASGFQAPPTAARPRVWWHWMNGNVSKAGVTLDLEWMHRIGVGGAQVFEGGLDAPLMIRQRVVYMTPEWRDVFNTAVDTAGRLGLELSMTTAPGWSETGGPWVRPEQAMKKLVWSQLAVEGGRPFSGRLPPLPDVAGPYQDIPIAAIEPSAAPKGLAPFARDAAVLAYRLPEADAAADVAAKVISSTGAVDAGLLHDGRFAGAIQLPAQPEATPAWIALDYGRPVTVRSVVVGMPGKRGFGAPLPAEARLEASDDGVHFRTVAELAPTRSPVRSASFAPVTARWFRLAVMRGRQPSFADNMFPAPGAVLFPMQPKTAVYDVSEFDLSSHGRVDHAEEKAGFATADDYYAIATPAAAVDQPVRREDVVDLTSRLQADGRLDWTPPPGRWRIVRFGYSLVGHVNGPAPVEATGLEADKLNAGDVSQYLEIYLGMYRQVRGGAKLGDAGISAILSDSIEAGPQNWTDDMLAQFKQRRGYDPTPWLPALTGVVVGGAEASDRFLWDYRRTIAELIAEAHYGVIARAAHQQHMAYYAEALEEGRPNLGDDMEMRTPADIPMGAMWMLPPSGKPVIDYLADLQGAASVAHLYGKPFVASETLTVGGRPWAMAPRDLKATADLAFALGVNRIVIHTSPAQPFTDGEAPGVAMATFVGQYFDRNETWAEQAKPWIDYLSRSAFMLQQGRYVADVAYFYGEEAPLTAQYQFKPMTDVPPGRGFDFVNAAALRDRLGVDRDGDLTTPDGMRYPVLMLGGTSRYMTLATLRRVGQLLDAGATVVGARPQTSPSGADDPATFVREAEAIWAKPRRAGGVYPDLASAFAARRLVPDWSVQGGKADVAVLHRRTADADIYFVVNRRPEAARLDMQFRVAGRDVQLWRADTGRMTPASYAIADGRTAVPLSLDAGEAVFVVFRGAAKSPSRQVPADRFADLRTLNAPWSLKLGPGFGAPEAPLKLDRLSSWSQSADPAVKYFSGAGAYRTEFAVSAADRSRPLYLDLGEVDDVAEVKVNGVSAGVLWKPPYRIDVSGLIRPGVNQLEIKVTNLWVNRLIGDAQPNAQSGAKPRYTVTPSPAYEPNAPLLPSGLIGPVRLEQLQ